VNAGRAPTPAVVLVAAVADGGVIGNRGSLPWRLPADMARFKALTMGHAVIVGRKTFQSIGLPLPGLPLPGRRVIVLTRDPAFRAPGCRTASTVEEALAAVDGDECFVIGGASVYAQFLPLASLLHITRIRAAFAGDAFFPRVDAGEWELVEQRPGIVDRENPLPHEFLTWHRRKA
jgi:dihydrofolate reductase